MGRRLTGGVADASRENLWENCGRRCLTRKRLSLRFSVVQTERHAARVAVATNCTGFSAGGLQRSATQPRHELYRPSQVQCRRLFGSSGRVFARHFEFRLRPSSFLRFMRDELCHCWHRLASPNWFISAIVRDATRHTAQISSCSVRTYCGHRSHVMHSLRLGMFYRTRPDQGVAANRR